MKSDTADFAANWYLVKRGVVAPARLAFLHDYALAQTRTALMAPGDVQVAGAPVAYCDAELDALLEAMRGPVEQATGFSLWPTFSYLRVYQRGNLLKAHRDRPSCEISMTVNLGIDAARPWPISIAGPNGIASVALAPGDGLIYRGCDCFHWREPFDGEHLAQAFLHYVDKNGPKAEWKFDKRPRLTPLAAAA